jgi:OmpA-OmpF porin, OOP family
MSTAKTQIDAFPRANSGVRFASAQNSRYTNRTGSARLNQRLSHVRADSVAPYLRSNGLQADRIVVKGFGAANLVASNGTAIGRAQNWRVEISVTAAQ